MAKKKQPTEPIYTVFITRYGNRNVMDERERELKKEYQAWKKNKKKVWYL